MNSAVQWAVPLVLAACPSSPFYWIVRDVIRCHAFQNHTKGRKTYIKSIFKEFDRLMDCLFRFIDAHTDTKCEFTHPYHGRSHGFISSNFSSFPHENETWERT